MMMKAKNQNERKIAMIFRSVFELNAQHVNWQIDVAMEI